MKNRGSERGKISRNFSLIGNVEDFVWLYSNETETYSIPKHKNIAKENERTKSLCNKISPINLLFAHF